MADALILSVKARLVADPASETSLWTAWNRVCDAIHAHVTAMRPKPRSFEVHHITETARKALLQDFAAGKAPEVAELSALASIGL